MSSRHHVNHRQLFASVVNLLRRRGNIGTSKLDQVHLAWPASPFVGSIWKELYTCWWFVPPSGTSSSSPPLTCHRNDYVWGELLHPESTIVFFLDISAESTFLLFLGRTRVAPGSVPSPGPCCDAPWIWQIITVNCNLDNMTVLLQCNNTVILPRLPYVM